MDSNYMQKIGKGLSKAYIAPNGKMYIDAQYGTWTAALNIFGIFPEMAFNDDERLIDSNNVVQGNDILDFLTDH